MRPGGGVVFHTPPYKLIFLMLIVWRIESSLSIDFFWNGLTIILSLTTILSYSRFLFYSLLKKSLIIKKVFFYEINISTSPTSQSSFNPIRTGGGLNTLLESLIFLTQIFRHIESILSIDFFWNGLTIILSLTSILSDSRFSFYSLLKRSTITKKEAKM